MGVLSPTLRVLQSTFPLQGCVTAKFGPSDVIINIQNIWGEETSRIVRVTRHQHQFSLWGMACWVIISLVPMFLPLVLFVNTVSLSVFLVAFSHLVFEVEIKIC